MRVFLSWSGNISRQVASALKEWIPSVLQVVEPWMSSDDILKGKRWSESISSELESCQFGIICVTKENFNAPWLLFEAGALSKAIQQSHVCPFLFGLKPTELSGPLVQFQMTASIKEDITKLMHTLNNALDTASITSDRLDKALQLWWPTLEKSLYQIQTNSDEVISVGRSDRELLEEALILIRGLYSEPNYREANDIEQRAWLLNYLKRCDEKTSKILLLHYSFGHGSRALADMLDTPVQECKSIIDIFRLEFMREFPQ